MKLLPLTHRVEGSVVDQAGKPIAGVEISVTSLPYPIEGPLHFDDRENRPAARARHHRQHRAVRIAVARRGWRRSPGLRIRGISARAPAPRPIRGSWIP